tara:strand:- start:936 stop:1901 length:966 start_codon:yes stop_codon:yes gene_type:complete
VEEKKYNLILSIGPPRTGTTYLFDLFYNAPPHVREKIIPAQSFKKLDKSREIMRTGKRSHEKFFIDKMRVKEDYVLSGLESFATVLHAKQNSLCDKTSKDCKCVENIAKYYFQRFETQQPAEDSTFFVSMPTAFDTLLNKIIPETEYNSDTEKWEKACDYAVQQMITVLGEFSKLFKNVTVIYGVRDKVEVVSSNLNLINMYNSSKDMAIQGHFHETKKHLEKFDNDQEFFQHLEEQVSKSVAYSYRVIDSITDCCTDIDWHGLDYNRLNDSEYMYNVLSSVFESEEQLKTNMAFGKKSYASLREWDYELSPTTIKFLTSI